MLFDDWFERDVRDHIAIHLVKLPSYTEAIKSGKGCGGGDIHKGKRRKKGTNRSTRMKSWPKNPLEYISRNASPAFWAWGWVTGISRKQQKRRPCEKLRPPLWNWAFSTILSFWDEDKWNNKKCTSDRTELNLRVRMQEHRLFEHRYWPETQECSRSEERWLRERDTDVSAGTE